MQSIPPTGFNQKRSLTDGEWRLCDYLVQPASYSFDPILESVPSHLFEGRPTLPLPPDELPIVCADGAGARGFFRVVELYAARFTSVVCHSARTIFVHHLSIAVPSIHRNGIVKNARRTTPLHGSRTVEPKTPP